jgi:hypothetical protein
MRQMKKQFSVTYEIKGVKIVNVTLPEGEDLPADWDSLTMKQRDEWLYDNQYSAHLIWTDEHEGEAVNILPITHLKAVV